MVRTLLAVMSVFVMPAVGAAMGALIGDATCEPEPALFGEDCINHLAVASAVGFGLGLIAGVLLAHVLRKGLRRRTDPP